MSEASTNEVERRFTYNRPNEDQVKLHELIRSQAKTLAHFWDGNLPNGREKALALTSLQEALMWANAAIASEVKNNG